jgi:hypothetical protein
MLVEMNVSSIYGPPVHRLQRNLQQTQNGAGTLRFRLNHIVETHLPFPPEDVQLILLNLAALIYGFPYLSKCDGETRELM